MNVLLCLKLFEKTNEIGSVGDQLVKTLRGKGGKGLSDELTKDILIEHFNQDDNRYTDLRNEFRKAASDDASKKKAAGLKSKLGKQLLKSELGIMSIQLQFQLSREYQ